ncbi:type 2 lanthipeptide synthetase LanM family protein [Streptomyces sp. NPDC059009]|uniref:type 2 lanthipeptide synthetase LanM family protein n=1 Tax=Streptomyces sp. NPDC059009 TaxID=3346694 RepID=UPI0036C4A78A
MTTPLQYYPEFDSAEVEETITPLKEFDAETLAVLDDPAAARLGAQLDAQLDARLGAWLDAPEDYPFQRVIRSVAAAVADTRPLDGFDGLLADPQDALIQLLGRAETRLRDVYTRPLVAAVNHAREQGLLQGATPKERYASFVDGARRTSFEAFSGLSFPVLRDVTRVVLRNEAAAARELCARLVADRPAIAAAFGIDAHDRLVSLGRSEGDTHHHGRSVSVLVFASGKRLVHKPRDVSCEAVYVTLAEELNSRLGTGLVSATVLRREGYGYVEFIEAEDVSDRPAEFMRASGELAAVLYLLNARDMHFENILPTRRGPLPIDLETILHPERIHTGPTPQAPGNAYATIGQSIYGIGILPLVMAGKDPGSGHVDLGFLGDQGSGASPFKSMQFVRPFTDEIGLAFRAAAAERRQTVAGSLSRDETYELGRHMADGFSRVFRAVMADRESWTDLLRRVAGDVRVRYVHNPTALYAQTLRMTAGPSALDSPAPYLALLKRIAIASKTSDRQLVRSEMRQLAGRDVPYFTVAATGTALTDGSGAEVGAHFAQSPLDLALDKAARLSEFGLGEQLRLLHSAFASRFPDNHLIADAHPAPAPGGRPPRDGAHTPLSLVTELCDRMVATSLPDTFAHLPRTWIGPLASADAGRPWPPGVLGYDLYTGRTGPALALAAAGRLLDHGAYRELAAQIFSTTADILASRRYETRSIHQAGYGGYTGMAGILFALSAAGRLLDEPDWTRAAQDAVPLVLDQLRAQPPGRVPLDVIGGVAGVLGCVQAIGGPHAETAVPELVALLGEFLRSDSPDAGGEAARSVLTQSGFAHGVSGIVHTLSQVLPHLPADRRDDAEKTLASLAGQLHGFYDPDARNWSSSLSAPGTFSTGWCHGAAGIALALSSYASVTGDASVARLRDQAVARTLESGFGRNLTWCHGDLGNHDILSSLAGPDGDALRAEIAAVEERWLRPDVFARKTSDARSRYAHTNSLMVGSAGIVLHLVNRLDPAHRVSPLTLTVRGD